MIIVVLIRHTLLPAHWCRVTVERTVTPLHNQRTRMRMRLLHWIRVLTTGRSMSTLVCHWVTVVMKWSDMKADWNLSISLPSTISISIKHGKQNSPAGMIRHALSLPMRKLVGNRWSIWLLPDVTTGIQDWLSPITSLSSTRQ